MPATADVKPTCTGNLLSSQYYLSVKLNHDIACECCSDIVQSRIPMPFFWGV